MADSILAIETYTQGLTAETFAEDAKTVDAVVRRFEILGEAANRLLRLVEADSEPWSALPLRDIVDMRNVLIHGYDSVDTRVLWRTIRTALPDFKHAVGRMRDDDA
jgi:uncharacterized protein with HEPN domain